MDQQNISNLFIDKLSLTRFVPVTHREKVLSNFELLKTYLTGNSFQWSYYDKEYNLYKKRIRVKIKTKYYAGDCEVHLLIEPTRANDIRFFKVEWNPSLLNTKEERAILKEFIVKLLGSKLASTLYYDAVITRLDLALDIYDEINNVDLYMKAGSSELHLTAGIVTGQVIGKNPRLLIYDKIIQLKSKGIDSPFKNHYRYEIMQRDLRYSIDQMPQKLKNPFKNVRFFDSHFLFDNDIEDGAFDNKFLNIARSSGLNSAFTSLGRRGLTIAERKGLTKAERIDKRKKKRKNLKTKYHRNLNTYYSLPPIRFKKPTRETLIGCLEFLK